MCVSGMRVCVSIQEDTLDNSGILESVRPIFFVALQLCGLEARCKTVSWTCTYMINEKLQ
jgi:hypothetical protein